jgi:hypothetical protein
LFACLCYLAVLSVHHGQISLWDTVGIAWNDNHGITHITIFILSQRLTRFRQFVVVCYDRRTDRLGSVWHGHSGASAPCGRVSGRWQHGPRPDLVAVVGGVVWSEHITGRVAHTSLLARCRDDPWRHYGIAPWDCH